MVFSPTPPSAEQNGLLICFSLKQDNVIIPIRGEGLVDDDQDQDQGHDAATTSSKVSYALHPNCGIFDDD
jgi:hypothetical protein